MAKCTFCITEFSIVHGGKHDIKRNKLQAKYIQPQRRRVCDLLAFKGNASSCCYGIKLDRGLADGVRKAVSKANADLAVARAE